MTPKPPNSKKNSSRTSRAGQRKSVSGSRNKGGPFHKAATSHKTGRGSRNKGDTPRKEGRSSRNKGGPSRGRRDFSSSSENRTGKKVGGNRERGGGSLNVDGGSEKVGGGARTTSGGSRGKGGSIRSAGEGARHSGRPRRQESTSRGKREFFRNSETRTRNKGGGHRSSGGRSRAQGSKTGGRSGSRGSMAGGRSGFRGSMAGGRDRHTTLGGEQVEGRQSVRELLLAGNRRVREIVLVQQRDPAPIIEDIVDLAKELKVTLRRASKSNFDSLARTEAPQGVVAFAEPLKPQSLEALATSEAGKPKPFLLLLDGISDPQNLGAILRSAECAGVTGVVLPRHRAARITPTAAKAAAGAIEYLPMALVGGMPAAMKLLSEMGVWTVGLDSSASQSVRQIQVADESLALVLGAEGPGLSRLVRERCDALASIPLQGRLPSLNVASAAAIACFEITHHRQ